MKIDKCEFMVRIILLLLWFDTVVIHNSKAIKIWIKCKVMAKYTQEFSVIGLKKFTKNMISFIHYIKLQSTAKTT